MANLNFDLDRLLTGVSNRPMEVQRQPIPGSPSFSGDFSAQTANSMKASLGNLVRGGRPTQAQQLNQAEAKYRVGGTIEDKKKLIEILVMRGDREAAAKIASEIQAMQQTGKQREQLIAQATRLNLPETAEIVRGGGDIEIAQKQVLEAEERSIVSKQGRKGKIAVAQSKNAGQPVYDAIKNGDYDNISDTLFLEQMKGEKADLKVFQQTIEGRPVSKPFRINDAGKVWDSTVGKWVNPSELGLTQAPQVTKQLSESNAYAKALTEGAAKNFLELNEKARSAEEILRTNKESIALLDRDGGIKTGFGAEFFLNVARVAKEVGMVPKDMDNVAATEQYLILRAEQLMKIMPAFGAGSGLSDSDREVASKIALRDISMDETALRTLLRLEEKYARDLITKSNKALERSVAIGKGGLSPELAESYYIPLPEREGYATSAERKAANKYLAPYLNPSQ